MTVSTATSRSGPYAGAGTTGPFTVNFRFLDAAHLEVIRTDATGEHVLVLSTDYSVSGVGNPTGSVTLLAALPVGQTLTIIRAVPVTQEADYVQNDDFPAESHETALDKLTMICQQIDEAVDRALVLPASSSSGVSTELPVPQSNAVIGWNESATALQNIDTGTLASIVAFSTATADLFSGNGAIKVFTLSSNPAAQNNLDVAIGGVTQRPGIDYTWTAGTTLTFTTAPPIGTNNVLARYLQALPQGYTDAQNVAYTPSGTGAVQTNAKAFLDSFLQYPSGQFFPEYGAKVNRLRDRLFAGDAASHLGTNVTSQADWLTIYQLAKGRSNGSIQSAQVAFLNGLVTDASNALVVGSQTGSLYAGYNAIAVTGIAVNNKVGSNGHAYGGYFEGYRNLGVTGGAYGVEIDTINYATGVQIDPYQQLVGQTIGLQIAGGGEYPAAGQADGSVAINIRKNGAAFLSGLMFGSDALTLVGSIGEAIAFGKGHKMQWYGAAGVGTSSIYCSGTTTGGGTAFEFGESFVRLLNSAGKGVFRFSSVASGVNFVAVSNSATGNPGQILVFGDDANIDIQMVPKGTGTIWLGTYTAGAVAQAGYITVKDSGGSVRRLLVG